MQKLKLISVTPDAEQTVGYVARVSNPNNQENPKVSGLLSYCIKHGHWSVFEQAHMTVELETTRRLAAQILSLNDEEIKSNILKYRKNLHHNLIQT